MTGATSAQSVTETSFIKGQIKNSLNNAVPFAAVFIPSTTKGTYADSLGNFSITSKIGDTLAISAIGYADTILIASLKSPGVVYLRKDIKTLDNVNVNARKFAPSFQQPSIIDQQVISNTFQDYVMGQNLSYSIINNLSTAPGTGRTSLDQKTFMSATPLSGGFYNGALLPVFTHIDATKGSRYLFETWVKGQVIDINDILISNDSYYFNYDKIQGNLLVTQDKKNVIEVDKQNIKVFEIKNDEQQYVFEKVVIGEEIEFLQVLARVEGKFGFYKSIKTKFKKADYVSTGLTESGHNYDEYIDVPTYYIVIAGTKDYKPVELKKKSIRSVLSIEQSKVNNYFAAHSDATMDEVFFKGLILFLNQ